MTAGSVFGKGEAVKLWESAEKVDVRVYTHSSEEIWTWEDVRTIQVAGNLIMFETIYYSGELVRMLVPLTSIMDIIFHKRSDLNAD